MDSHKITNAWAKTHMAVRHLAAAEQTVQQRVIDAFNKHLARIPNEGLPQDIVSRLDEVRANLILSPASAEGGAILRAPEQLDLESAQQIAKDIVQLYWSICQLRSTSPEVRTLEDEFKQQERFV